jgi:hypothetical protein
MNETNETSSYAYLIEDVMKGNFKYAWKPEKLWKLAKTKKIIKYKMNDVKHWVYNPCWSKGGYFVSIYQVLMQQKKFPDHMDRISNAKIKYPLICIEDDYDKNGSILDGNHRFAKMILEKRKIVNVVYFTKEELKKIRIKM